MMETKNMFCSVSDVFSKNSVGSFGSSEAFEAFGNKNKGVSRLFRRVFQSEDVCSRVLPFWTRKDLFNLYVVHLIQEEKQKQYKQQKENEKDAK